MKRYNWTIFISLLSLAIAALCAAFVILKNLKMGVGIDEGATFVGICTSLISTCATIMVGLQIFNYLEFYKVKEKTKELEEHIAEISLLKEEIKKEKKHLERVTNVFARGTSNSFDRLAKHEMEGNNPNIVAILDSIFSLNATMYMTDISSPRTSQVIKRRLEFILGLANKFQSQTVSSENFVLDFKEYKKIVFPKSYKNYFEIVKLHSETVIALKKIIKEQ